jgi:FkbM family methyltransferase
MYLGFRSLTYLDIGAHDPTLINNTYLFYTMGFRGVLVEPNAALTDRLREVRPRDTTLVAGIGVTAAREADYYLMTEPSWNTFSKEEAEHQVEATKGRVSIKEVVKVPLLDINDVMDEHFKGAPDFVSIDAEGLHLALLKAIDYQRFRPKAICVETLVSGTNLTIPEIPAFMEQHGYVERGRSFVNTIFVDSKIL